jgi:hypothetical protein
MRYPEQGMIVLWFLGGESIRTFLSHIMVVAGDES